MPRVCGRMFFHLTAVQFASIQCGMSIFADELERNPCADWWDMSLPTEGLTLALRMATTSTATMFWRIQSFIVLGQERFWRVFAFGRIKWLPSYLFGFICVDSSRLFILLCWGIEISVGLCSGVSLWLSLRAAGNGLPVWDLKSTSYATFSGGHSADKFAHRRKCPLGKFLSVTFVSVLVPLQWGVSESFSLEWPSCAPKWIEHKKSSTSYLKKRQFSFLRVHIDLNFVYKLALDATKSHTFVQIVLN